MYSYTCIILPINEIYKSDLDMLIQCFVLENIIFVQYSRLLSKIAWFEL